VEKNESVAQYIDYDEQTRRSYLLAQNAHHTPRLDMKREHFSEPTNILVESRRIFQKTLKDQTSVRLLLL